MEQRTKRILIGVSAAVAIGATIYFVSSESTQKKIISQIKRQKARCYVKDKLRGNKKAVALVDKLSDNEVDHLLSTVHRVSDLEGKLAEYSNQIKTVSTDLKDNLKDRSKEMKKKIAS
ncbi:hypothetical protein [Lacticigenium naphthae]|uniref:hypothetical protein n=1 Tax=Lacticigenium naphthae TaxID=515351 RepID=UPI0004222031|nr:hypothetical protein [Lacticigenium naphthae]